MNDDGKDISPEQMVLAMKANILKLSILLAEHKDPTNERCAAEQLISCGQILLKYLKKG